MYVFDTNSFRVLTNYYQTVFPSFWERFEEVVSAGEVVSVREAYRELEGQVKDSWLWDWIQEHKEELFTAPASEETLFVGRIFKVPHFRALVGERQRLTGQAVADPFLIARAAVSKGWVVTEEKYKKHGVKIPNVCEHFGVQCTNVSGFIQQMGWTF